MIHFILATPMTQAMEIHDAELLELACNGDGAGHVLFHAFIYRSEGTVFEDAYEAGWQNFRLDFEGMRVEGEFVAPRSYASDGQLSVNGVAGNGILRLPVDHTGDLHLELLLSPLFDPLTIHATEVRSTLQGSWELEDRYDSLGNKT